MEDRLRNLFGNGYASAIIWIIGTLSFILSIYFYQKTKVNKKVYITYDNIPLLSSTMKAIEKLDIYYDSHKLEDLYTLRIKIVNIGSVIKKSDIAQKAPIEFLLSDNCNILFYDSLPDTPNNYTISQTQNKITVLFDYMEKKDSITFNLLHTGSDKVKVKGKIIGGKKIVENDSNLPSPNTDKKLFLATFIILLSGLSFQFEAVLFLFPLFMVIIGFSIIISNMDALKLYNDDIDDD